jgi:hypothetical protein
MTNGDDRLLEILGGLPPVAADPEWEDRVRQRCRSEMSRRSRHGRSWVDFAAAVGLCVYFAAVLIEAARLAGSL